MYTNTNWLLGWLLDFTATRFRSVMLKIPSSTFWKKNLPLNNTFWTSHNSNMIFDKKNPWALNLHVAAPRLDSQICIASENRGVIDLKACFVAFKT